MTTRLDCHWVLRNGTAQAELERQGYQAMDYRLGRPAYGRVYWVNMCKQVEVQNGNSFDH